MSPRLFTYDDQEWEAAYDGTGVGGGAVGPGGYIPPVTRYSVTFRCISNPERKRTRGYASDSDLNAVSDAELVSSLKRALGPQKPL